MWSTLSPAFTSSKMRNMFVLISECGKQLGDFLEECIMDKKMKVKGCKIERGKYSPTITFFHTAAVIQIWHARTHMYTQNTHTILYHSPPSHPHHMKLLWPLKELFCILLLNYPTLQLPLVKSRLYSLSILPFYSSHWSRSGRIPFSNVPFHIFHWSRLSNIHCSTVPFHSSQ